MQIWTGNICGLSYDISSSLRDSYFCVVSASMISLMAPTLLPLVCGSLLNFFLILFTVSFLVISPFWKMLGLRAWRLSKVCLHPQKSRIHPRGTEEMLVTLFAQDLGEVQLCCQMKVNFFSTLKLGCRSKLRRFLFLSRCSVLSQDDSNGCMSLK